ncbi:MAG: hypothetical protein JW838_09410 [Spirochaetes bacterium]|nr:hypothetical protein [Spirochaetota bacterium]
MKVTTGQLSRLFEVHGEGIEITYFDDVVIAGNSCLSTDLLLPAHIPKLQQNNIQTVEVFYTTALYDMLSREFPADFRKPFGCLRLPEMDRLLEELRDVNAHTRRKRYLRMVGDIYGIDSTAGKRVILLHHNEPLDMKKWNDLKREVARSQQFLYRNSEVPIIIFTDLKSADGKRFVDRFSINADIISLLVTRTQEPGTTIAPDFVPTEDVISVTEPPLLLEEYIRTNARMIIIGEELDDICKRALLEVRNYDRYVRLLVVPALNRNNLQDFFRQVQLVYSHDRWK